MNLKAELQKAFSSSDLLLSDASYGEVWQQIYQSGASYQEELKRISGRKTWKRVFHSDNTKISEQDRIRILGFGAAITEYMIPAFNLPKAEHTTVVQLGTLANFIVTFFDYCLDTHNYKEPLLPQPSKLINNKLSELGFIFRALVNPKVKFINRLVKYYLQSIKHLPFARHRPQIVKLIHRAIKLMYEAEMQTVTGDGSNVSVRTIRRKSALPFVIMALPVWLSVEKIDKMAFILHLRWSYHFGYFFCLLDDAVDLFDDIHNNHPNYFLSDDKWLESPELIVKCVVDHGVRVRNDWNKKIRAVNVSSTELIFPALIRSWLGRG